MFFLLQICYKKCNEKCFFCYKFVTKNVMKNVFLLHVLHALLKNAKTFPVVITSENENDSPSPCCPFEPQFVMVVGWMLWNFFGWGEYGVGTRHLDGWLGWWIGMGEVQYKSVELRPTATNVEPPRQLSFRLNTTVQNVDLRAFDLTFNGTERRVFDTRRHRTPMSSSSFNLE